MVELLQQTSVTVQSSGLSDISPGFGLSFPNEGDLMLLVVATSGAVGYDLQTDGWTEILLAEHDPTYNLAFGLWYQVYHAAEWHGNPVIGVENFTGKSEFCFMLVLGGVDYRDPIDIVNSKDQGDGTTDIGPITGLTPSNPGAGVIVFGIRHDGNASAIDTLSGDIDWEEMIEHSYNGQPQGLGLAMDLGVDPDGPTAVSDKTFTTDGDSAAYAGFMFTVNGLLLPDNPQGWPRAIAAAPADGQGWPRGEFPNANDAPSEADDRQLAILAASPVAYWPLREDFTEKAGGAAPDLTPHGSPSFVGGAVDLDGSSQYMLAEDFNPYTGASILTFLAFIARDGTGSYQAILGSYISSYDFYFNSGTSQLVCGDHGSGSQKFLSNTEDYIGSSVQPLFIEISDTGDVVNVWSGTTPDGSNGFAIDFSTVSEPDFAIGLDIGVSNTGAGSYFPGLVSDVAIWDRALTSGERSAIVAATL